MSATVSTTATSALRLTAVTYNILADKYATSGFHSYCDSRWLQWRHRLPLILAELDGYNADVICLQEVPCTQPRAHKPTFARINR